MYFSYDNFNCKILFIFSTNEEIRKSMNGKVSVIIPTYKRSDFLERALESVLAQSYANIEVVVVDDNEPNSSFRAKTEEKMKKYSEDKRIKYIKNKKNLGGALARN